MKLQNKDEIRIIWTTNDVLGVSQDLGIELTIDEARDILGLMERKHDASIGINWDVISYWVESYHSFIKND